MVVKVNGTYRYIVYSRTKAMEQMVIKYAINCYTTAVVMGGYMCVIRVCGCNIKVV